VSLEDARALAKWTYPLAKAEAEARVVRWEWADSTRWSLEPGYFEVHKYRRGALLDVEPDPPFSGAHGHGFDVAGVLAVERQQTELPGARYETFYAARPGGLARRHFDYSPAKRPINSAFLEVEGSRVTRIDTVYAGGRHLAEVFHHDAGGRLVEVERTGPGDIHDFRDVEHDDQGIVRVYWRHLDGRRVLHYERPAADETLASGRARITAGLTRAIREALAARPPTAEVYALALWWCEAEYQHRLPPNVAVGTVVERDRFLAKHPTRAKVFLWNPAEWGNALPLALDADLARLCATASEDIWQNGLHAEADVVVATVAAELRRVGLPVATTADVVTYAVQVDARASAAAQLSRQITPAQRAAFKQRGML